ncbi:hypothetical protein KY321_05490 [Candidatus Woesearchaeota archaeon]|nr:hypothetical protein [Candidatus Woesearchaeota archaeon]
MFIGIDSFKVFSINNAQFNICVSSITFAEKVTIPELELLRSVGSTLVN